MSLFGKVLALLNILGAIALLAFASLDYSKRSAWGDAALRHELALHGLPLDDKEFDNDHKLRTRRVDKTLLDELFAQAGGNPVKTQVDEVRRLKGETDESVTAAGTDKAGRKAYALARVLRGLAGTAAERDEIAAALFYLKDDASLQALQAQHLRAFREAQKAVPPELLKINPRATFPEAYQFALRAEGGLPSDAIANEIARQLPDNPAQAKALDFNKLFQAALEKEQASLEAKYTRAFAAALGTVPEGQDAAKPYNESQKAAVARLLFGLIPYQADKVLSGPEASAEDAALLKGVAPGTAEYDARVAATKTFEDLLRRALVITGPRELTGAVAARATAVRDMAGEVRADASREQSQFVSDNAAVLRQLRALADILRDEKRRSDDVKGLETSQSSLAKAQAKAALDRKGELDASIRQTGIFYSELKAKSEALLKNRQAIQGVIRQTETGETHVRYLEKLARDLESEKK